MTRWTDTLPDPESLSSQPAGGDLAVACYWITVALENDSVITGTRYTRDQVAAAYIRRHRRSLNATSPRQPDPVMSDEQLLWSALLQVAAAGWHRHSDDDVAPILRHAEAALRTFWHRRTDETSSIRRYRIRRLEADVLGEEPQR